MRDYNYYVVVLKRTYGKLHIKFKEQRTKETVNICMMERKRVIFEENFTVKWFLIPTLDELSYLCFVSDIYCVDFKSLMQLDDLCLGFKTSPGANLSFENENELAGFTPGLVLKQR